MKLLHLSDLHIGKRVGEFSMLEDQRWILQQILRIAEQEKPAGILMAGDIYDKNLPSGEAVELLDDFLTELVGRKLPVFIVSGNHDSPERLNFGSRIMAKNGLEIAGTFTGLLRHEMLEDEFGKVNLFLLPFLKPAMARPYFDKTLDTYDDAVRTVIETAAVDPHERNILVAHQFVTSGNTQPDRSDSETIAVGGLDNVDVSAFNSFDYVALGHLHGPQRIGRDTIRYAGSPLKYSFSEARQHKSVTLIDLREKGQIDVRLIPLSPQRDLREIKGPLAALLESGAQNQDTAQDYIHAILTDEEEIYDAVGQLRRVYPNLMHLDFDNSRTQPNSDSQTAAAEDVAHKDPLELFDEFYQNQNNAALTPAQRQVMENVLAQAGGMEQ